MNEKPANSTPISFGNSLENALKKPRSEWSVDDLAGLFSDGRVVLINLMHVGGDGWLKTLDFVPRSVEHLKDIIQGGERADGSSLFPNAGIPTDASDIVLRPRLESAFIDPFAPRTSLVLMCSHSGRDGTPLPQSPDTIVRRAYERLSNETGIELWALGEVEYFLGKRWDETDIYGADDRGYHATAPFVFGEELRREALALLHDIGVPVKYGHSEVGYIEARETEGVIWEQHEIELGLAPLPTAADGILLTQWVLRNLAHRRGMRCNTDPVMLQGHAGNGLHFHFAPVSNGSNMPIRDGDGRLSDAARWLIGGLVEMGEALMAFGNRSPDSFIRVSQAKEAPSGIFWGEYDRNALIRLPITSTDEAGRELTVPTIEFRLPDGSALPHLLMAGAALAMIHGRDARDLDDLLRRTSAAQVTAPGGSIAPVPGSFPEVADALTRHRETLERDGTFPTTLLDRIIARLRS
jgi:glutamine synthetase